MLQGNFLKIPQPGDRGSLFCPALSENMDSLDSHVHDGISSEKITSSSIVRAAIDLLSENWQVDASGDFKQLVTLPIGYKFNECSLRYVTNDGLEISPTVLKISDNSFHVLIMSPITLKVLIV